ncbi:L-histidine N(alpha)-methyltransferase [Flagellimonas allohymeniacidonis]|uniref:L-histidine N(Alpha)-methyltransferase n=1 Tax=Flagellimonas allohymeniacidonis TaxID=2517819 RepID=A0A4Q8QEM9_9FLAO|nr:L-histidine N(alpha)-methyltransferase [Allomuricauda hymeniacidonis]TAI46963.1 L-histidine N(alpha)-methyltransferase [Allomuricauda hymeniacidonis]
MQNKNTPVFTSAFEQEVFEGLTTFPKHLSSKYFYDEVGDKLFQDIMAMPEYYLTNCEFDILENHKEEIASLFAQNGDPFSLFELGAGDGKKTKILLQHLVDKSIAFDYRPIDISQNALDQLEASLKLEIPQVSINTLQGTYFDTLRDIGETNGRRKVILFLGSNIGNLLHPQAVEFLINMRDAIHEDDLIFMGLDQKKNPQTILDAYNDKAGITEAFNKNILSRINKEMGGDFNLDNFLHWEVYDPETGTAKSYLVSKVEQTVHIESLDLEVRLKRWETIHTEISQKYDDEVVEWLAEKSGLQVVTSFSDPEEYFKNYVLKK